MPCSFKDSEEERGVRVEEGKANCQATEHADNSGDGDGGHALGSGDAGQEHDSLNALPEHCREAEQENGPVGAAAGLLALLQHEPIG